MIPLDEARAHVLGRCRRFGARSFALREASGLVAASEIVSTESVPPFANTAMDGFAVRAADTAGAPVTLSIVGTVAAGQASGRAVLPGEAMRIMTGAPLPPGADAVVMVERTTVTDDGDEVEIEVTVEAGNHVREAGEDLRPGSRVVAAGTVLAPAHLGVLASLGVEAVEAFPRARVGVLSTGDELREGPVALEPGQIRDSNRPSLLALVAEVGCEPVDLGCVADDEAAITASIEAATTDCDALLTSGGVSMGDFDYVKVVLDRLGDMRWMQVAIKPAKPLAFGEVGGMPVFGLPGNPVSSMVSFELFARPALRQMMGHTTIDRPVVQAIAADGLGRRADGKVHFLRVRCAYEGGGFVVRSAGGQGSHQLGAMADANALAVVPDGGPVSAGDAVATMLLGPVGGPFPGPFPGGAPAA